MKITIDVNEHELVVLRHLIDSASGEWGEPLKDIHDTRGYDEDHDEKKDGYHADLKTLAKKVRAIK